MSDQGYRRAAELAAQASVGSRKRAGALSPEEIEKTIHELTVHQIELEMQG